MIFFKTDFFTGTLKAAKEAQSSARYLSSLSGLDDHEEKSPPKPSRGRKLKPITYSDDDNEDNYAPKSSKRSKRAFEDPRPPKTAKQLSKLPVEPPPSVPLPRKPLNSGSPPKKKGTAHLFIHASYPLKLIKCIGLRLKNEYQAGCQVSQGGFQHPKKDFLVMGKCFRLTHFFLEQDFFFFFQGYICLKHEACFLGPRQ